MNTLLTDKHKRIREAHQAANGAYKWALSEATRPAEPAKDGTPLGKALDGINSYFARKKAVEPVAWGIYNPTLRSYELSKEKVETKYRDDGTVVYVAVPFVTTDQAEAYANARVREALTEVAEMCDNVFSFAVGDSVRDLMYKMLSKNNTIDKC